MMRQNKRRNVTSATRFLCDALLVWRTFSVTRF
jgi:hypothetical protein